MTFAIPTKTEFSESVCRIVMLFDTRQLDQISRWSVIGKVPMIIRALKESLVYEKWMEEYLDQLEQSARESL